MTAETCSVDRMGGTVSVVMVTQYVMLDVGLLTFRMFPWFSNRFWEDDGLNLVLLCTDVHEVLPEERNPGVENPHEDQEELSR